MNIIIAAGPVIIEDNKVLVNKHGDTDFWKFPGGKVDDFAELDVRAHAKREAKEEMNIDIEIIKPLSTLLTKKGDDVVVLIHFLAKRIGEVKPAADIREWAWLDIHHLPADIAPNIKPIIDECLAEGI
ncbi:MAG: NUDIX domain-containing protein [Patescibacteria group bacterium]|jgi:ADP-ribose pyrophosphatase YjhB (NUDIX family)